MHLFKLIDQYGKQLQVKLTGSRRLIRFVIGKEQVSSSYVLSSVSRMTKHARVIARIWKFRYNIKLKLHAFFKLLIQLQSGASQFNPRSVRSKGSEGRTDINR